jgi:glycosyltransferase involved in cell wall biosynthesis
MTAGRCNSVSPVQPLDVLHLIDTLEIGGAERVAVNLINQLPVNRFRAHLCTTRRDGPLSSEIRQEVPRLRLQRRWWFDPIALIKLVRYIRAKDIRILHAHGTAIFLARIVAAITPKTCLIWHNHNGASRRSHRPIWVHRLAVRKIAGVIAVNKPLAKWANSHLQVPPDRVWQLNNFVVPKKPRVAGPELPGQRPLRVACVANLRPVKGHRDLLEAIASVKDRVPSVQLVLIGAAPDLSYLRLLEDDVRRLGIGAAISFLGQRSDVDEILQECAVAVLSSHDEGFPVSLLEYGRAGLAVVVTDTGECAEILDAGRCGLVVGVGQIAELALAIERLLTDQQLRTLLAERFSVRVETRYSGREVILHLCRIYESVLPTLTSIDTLSSSLIHEDGQRRNHSYQTI